MTYRSMRHNQITAPWKKFYR